MGGGGRGELISSVKTFRNMIFLTIVACEIDRNRYFAGMDQRNGSDYQLWIMGI